MTVYIETFRVRADTGDRVQIGSGSGFLVLLTGGHALVTNWHVLTGRNRITGEPKKSGQPLPTEADVHFWTGTPSGEIIKRSGTMSLYDDAERPLWTVHPHHGRLVDIAALDFRVELTDGSRLMPYRLGRLDDPAILFPTSDVNIVGYPAAVGQRSASAVWTRATIASEPHEDFDGLPSFLVDARARDGQSGSPVIGFWLPGEPKQTANGALIEMTPRWELFGIYSGRITKKSDLGRVWKRAAIVEVLTSGVRDDLVLI